MLCRSDRTTARVVVSENEEEGDVPFELADELELAAIDAAESEPMLASRKPDKFFSVDSASAAKDQNDSAAPE